MTFGAALRHLRKRKRLTLQQVAEALGVKYPAVQQWETDKTVPQRDKIKLLGSVLGADINYIYPRPHLGVNVEIDDDTIKYIVDDFDKKLKLEEKGAHLSRIPWRYALHHESIERRKLDLEFYVKAGKKVDTLEHVYILKTTPESDSLKFDIHIEASEYMTKPDAIGYMKFPFGIRMPNSSMSPRYDINELILFDDISVKEYAGFALVTHQIEESNSMSDCRMLRIISMNQKEIIGYTLNPIEHFQIAVSEQIVVYRALGISDLIDDLTPDKMKVRLR